MIDLAALLEELKVSERTWHQAYLEAVTDASSSQRPSGNSTANGFDSPTFQRWLWNQRDGAISVGRGTRAAVGDGAFTDNTLIRQFAAIRDAGDGPSLTADLQGLFDNVLAYVTARHTTGMRPRARLLRIFALLRPWDVTGIVWDDRLRASLRAADVDSGRRSLMAKHRLLIDTLWERLGRPDTLEDQVWLNMLAHRLSAFDPTPRARLYEPVQEYRKVVRPSAALDVGSAYERADERMVRELRSALPVTWQEEWLPGQADTLPELPLSTMTTALTEATEPGTVIDPGMLAVLHAALTALPDKRFVVIGGLSGTGKTTFARNYSRALCAIAEVPQTAVDEHICFVAVQPDWTEPAGLLGHANFIFETPRWHRTPALDLLMAAAVDPTRPYVLVLEEMNLARPEHYLAPLLAAMENPGAGLRLHGEPDRVGGVPPLLPWPRNLFIIGTVNMDATTFAFSDKVLDRAFIWEMDGVEIDAWKTRKAALESASPHLDSVATLLAQLYEPLEKAGRHFGYRVCNEVLAFCDAADSTDAEVLDAAIFSKILPRLRGDDRGGLARAIQSCLKTCTDLALTRCASRLERMRESLSMTGTARFWS